MARDPDRTLGGVIDTRNECVSGFSCEHCAVVSSRFDDLVGFQRGYAESWIVRVEPDGNEHVYSLERGWDDQVTGVWVSDQGTLFAATPEGVTHNRRFFSPDSARSWVDEHTDLVMLGVFGLSEDFVVAWGSDGDDDHALLRFDGTAWQPMTAPDFFVADLHGVSPTVLWAIGAEGEVARFDGHRWQELPSRSLEPLTSVCAVDRDEVYGVGAWGGVYEGSAYGWTEVARVPRNAAGRPTLLLDVAYWNDELWVAAGMSGLWMREGRSHRMVQISEDITAMNFDAREKLIMATKNDVHETADGQQTRRAAIDMVSQVRAGKELAEW